MGDFWVFGYGSLMWNPGFPYVEAVPALLEGHHRSFCIWSRHHRGTPDRPGLVLGLNPGSGRCQGMAFSVRPEDAAGVRDYLRERELVGYAYREATVPVTLRDGRRYAAYTFVADRDHRHYAGDLPVAEAAAVIMAAQGCAGLNRDYLMNTVRALERHGVFEPALHALLKEVERRTGELDVGGGI